MLPAHRRVHRREEFGQVVRQGRRAGSAGLVVHLLERSSSGPARAGFVVPRSVGPAVVRNRVRRRLRHLMAAQLDRLAPGTEVVVRVLPGAAQQSRRELAAELERLLDRAHRQAAGA